RSRGRRTAPRGARNRGTRRLARARGGRGQEVLRLLRLPSQNARRKRKGDEGRLKLALGQYEKPWREALRRLEQERAVERIWSADAGLWKDDPAARSSIENAQGWLTIPQRLEKSLDGLDKLDPRVREETDRVLVLAVAGS